MQQLAIKRGDTLSVGCQLVDEFGVGLTLSGLTINARLYDFGGNNVHTFTTQVINEASGQYALAVLETADLPVALYTLDIGYVKNGAQVSSSRIELNVLKRAGETIKRHAQVDSLIGKTRIVLGVPESLSSLFDIQWDVEWI